MNSSEQNTSSCVEQIISKASEQIASLKGLLKGKGEVEDSDLVINHAKELRRQIKRLMEDLLETINRPPYTYFNLKIRIQNSSDNSYLRWRDNAMELMGVQVWEKAMLNPPNANKESLMSWLKDLTLFEKARLSLNRYMSYLAMLIKQHEEYVENINYVETIFTKATIFVSTGDKN